MPNQLGKRFQCETCNSEVLCIKPGDGDPKGQLYNLEKDPSETNNIWETHPDVVTQLTKLLESVRGDD